MNSDSNDYQHHHHHHRRLRSKSSVVDGGSSIGGGNVNKIYKLDLICNKKQLYHITLTAWYYQHNGQIKGNFIYFQSYEHMLDIWCNVKSMLEDINIHAIPFIYKQKHYRRRKNKRVKQHQQKPYHHHNHHKNERSVGNERNENRNERNENQKHRNKKMKEELMNKSTSWRSRSS